MSGESRPMLEGRSALVLGANGAIGSACAHLLCEHGAHVVLAARDRDRLATLCRDLRSSGGRCESVGLDIRDDRAVEDAVGTAARSAQGRLDVAVNNVGTSHRPTPLADLAMDDVDRVLAVTLRGTALAMKHELRAMSGGGSIVNVASTAGVSAAAGMSAYVAAKHGVLGLTRTAALDHAGAGIRVNAVVPGPVASGGVLDQPPQVRRRIGEHVPLGRLAHPEEVAQAVVWLASPLSSFTTGAALPVDGGLGA